LYRNDTASKLPFLVMHVNEIRVVRIMHSGSRYLYSVLG